jgi:hypothetical protein
MVAPSLMTVSELARVLEPLVKSTPDMRVVFHPCEPDGPFEDAQSAEGVPVDKDSLANSQGPDSVLVIN